jgi:hypothetical protein
LCIQIRRIMNTPPKPPGYGGRRYAPFPIGYIP